MYKSFVEFSLASACVNNCVYCPQAAHRQAYKGEKLLSLENFKIMVDKIPKSCISIAGFSEPFSNPYCLDMIDYAGKNGHMVILYTTLVGMDIEMYDRLRRMYNIRGFTVHLPDKEGYTKINITDKYKKLLKMVTVHGLSGCTTDFSLHGTAVHPDIQSIINIPNPVHRIHDRAGQLRIDDNSIHRIHYKTGKIVCGNGFGYPESGLVLTDGTVVLCCMDFRLEYVLGNLLTQSWAEIMDSPVRKRVLQDQITGGYDDICRHCCEAVLDTRGW